MTDAALPVTQSAVETFTQRYLSWLGADIEKEDSRWAVTVPEDVEGDVQTGEIVLVCEGDENDLTSDEIALHPESDFFVRLLDDAAKRQPIGAMQITNDYEDGDSLDSIIGESVVVESTDFYPYYDRNAVAVLFRISIETVSEYEAELLRAVAVDSRTHEPLPELAVSYLDRTGPEADEVAIPGDIENSRRSTEKSLQRAREQVEQTIQPRIAEVHSAASRSADVELEEYHQMQQQRIDELREEIRSLEDQIEGLSQTTHSTDDQQERVASLRKRKELRSQHDPLQEELNELIKRHEAGFPKQQRKIRDRHSVTAVIKPVSITVIEYEVGDLELELREGDRRAAVALGYGSGIGLTEEPSCSECGESFSNENPIRLSDGKPVGGVCCRPYASSHSQT